MLAERDQEQFLSLTCLIFWEISELWMHTGLGAGILPSTRFSVAK